MKEKEQGSNWDQNLQIMTGRPLSICEEEDLKQSNNVLEGEKLVSRDQVLLRASPQNIDLAVMEESFDLSVHPVVNHYQKPHNKSTRSKSRRNPRKTKNRKKFEELYQKQKSVDKRTADASDVDCLCCSINGTCVGVVGVFLLIALGVALLSVPGAGRLPETVEIFIRDKDEFMSNYNDSLGYEFLVLKHIRSYMRFAFLRKADIPKTYISVTFQLGWIDDHLGSPGITKLLFDRLPYETFFRRDAINSDFFRIVHRNGGHYNYEVGSAITQVNMTISNEHFKDLLKVFSKTFSFGHTSVPWDIGSFQIEKLQTPSDFNNFMDLLPSRDEYTPKLVSIVD